MKWLRHIFAADPMPQTRTEMWGHVVFDAEGFGPVNTPSVKMPWNRIRRVACGYKMHPIVIADDDFWAFQTDDPALFFWVAIDASPDSRVFTAEVTRRYRTRDIPPMKDWVDRDSDIRAYTIWPTEDIGKPMYTTRAKHWWSCKAYLLHAQQ